MFRIHQDKTLINYIIKLAEERLIAYGPGLGAANRRGSQMQMDWSLLTMKICSSMKKKRNTQEFLLLELFVHTGI